MGGYFLTRSREAPQLEPEAWEKYAWDGGAYLPPLTFEYPSEWALLYNRYRTPHEQERGLPGELESLTIAPCQQLAFEGGNIKGKGLPICELEYERLNGISIGTGRQTECRSIPEATLSQCVDGVLVSTMSTDREMLVVFDRFINTLRVFPQATQLKRHTFN